MPTLALVGGQYGSEGKGVIAAHLAHQLTCAVRTGGPNAGHTIYHEGRVWKMRSVPCAWINPKAVLIIGPGGVIDPETLDAEVDALEDVGYHIRGRLIIDEQVTIISEDDRFWEGDIELGELIGSTLEGVGSARRRKIARRSHGWVTAHEALGERYRVEDTTSLLATNALIGRVMLEGTQGFGLSLHGTKWPYVTSANCTTAQLYSDAMLAHGGMDAVLVVFRSYPIRVGGNSGPMEGEHTWDEMAELIGYNVVPERTTVTNKIRRIAEWDWELAERAVMVNGATALALTFADYIDPACIGETSFYNLPSKVRAFVDLMEDRLGEPVALVGTGGPTFAICDRTADKALYRGGTGVGEDYHSPRPS